MFNRFITAAKKKNPFICMDIKWKITLAHQTNLQFGEKNKTTWKTFLTAAKMTHESNEIVYHFQLVFCVLFLIQHFTYIKFSFFLSSVKQTAIFLHVLCSTFFGISSSLFFHKLLLLFFVFVFGQSLKFHNR